MRSIWKGSIGFGMVVIPVKLYGACDDNAIKFNQLHAECGSRIKMPKHCPNCDRDLEAGEIIKAFPIGERYVPITPEEMEMLPLSSIKSIQVEAFIKEIADPRYFEKSYLLSPDEVGVKAFVLFVQAMEKAKVMGVAKVAIREKEQMCSVRPFNGILLLQTLHWSNELRNYGDLVPFASVSEQEMAMAGQLIGGMTKEVDLTSYHDEYREALLEMIGAKLAGKTIEAPPPQPKQTDADLAKQLLASLNALQPAG